jgi:hypothetical protein
MASRRQPFKNLVETGAHVGRAGQGLREGRQGQDSQVGLHPGSVRLPGIDFYKNPFRPKSSYLSTICRYDFIQKL